jgi:hypothetical protein
MVISGWQLVGVAVSVLSVNQEERLISPCFYSSFIIYIPIFSNYGFGFGSFFLPLYSVSLASPCDIIYPHNEPLRHDLVMSICFSFWIFLLFCSHLPVYFSFNPHLILGPAWDFPDEPINYYSTFLPFFLIPPACINHSIHIVLGSRCVRWTNRKMDGGAKVAPSSQLARSTSIELQIHQFPTTSKFYSITLGIPLNLEHCPSLIFDIFPLWQFVHIDVHVFSQTQSAQWSRYVCIFRLE